MHMGGVDHVGRDHRVFVKKFSSLRVVRQNAADLRRGHEDRMGFVFRHPGVHRGRVDQVGLRPICGQNLAAFACQSAHDGGADHALVAADPDALFGKGIVSHDALSGGLRGPAPQDPGRPFR